MMKKLKCPACSGELNLEVTYTGCDWESEAGEGSGFGYPLSLACMNDDCRRIYTLGYLNKEVSFSPVMEHKPYNGASGYLARGEK